MKLDIPNRILFSFQSVILKMVLDYINEPETDHSYAGILVGAIFLINVCRGAAFNGMFVVGTHTGKHIYELENASC